MKLCSNGDGRKAHRRGLCQACLRDAPRVLTPAGEGGKVEFRAPLSLVEHAEHAAKLAGLSLPAWWRMAGREKILRDEAERRFGRSK